MEFPAEIVDAIYKLRNKYKNTKHCVIASFPILEIVQVEGGIKPREISTKLFFNNSAGTFELQAPDHQYFSRISHYDFNRTERRWSRDKAHIFKLIHDLKYCGLWKFVTNKDIVIINALNEKADAKKLLADLDDLTKE